MTKTEIDLALEKISLLFTSEKTVPETKKKPIKTVNTLCMFGPEILIRIIDFYIDGVAIMDISDLYKITEKEINDILDRYVPYL